MNVYYTVMTRFNHTDTPSTTRCTNDIQQMLQSKESCTLRTGYGGTHET